MQRTMRLGLTVLWGSVLTTAVLVLLLAGSGGLHRVLAAGPCTAPGPGHPTIQSAIDDSNCSSVIVAVGTHHVNLIISRTLTLQGASKTGSILDGGRNGPVIRVSGGVPVIENLTIMDGDASNALGCGGGVSIIRAAATVRNNIIKNNVASSDPNLQGWGGGVCVMTGTGTVSIYDNTIQSNAAFSATTANRADAGLGGGIGILRGGYQAVITANHILSNVAARLTPSDARAIWAGGGGIQCEADYCDIRSNTIQGNVANGAVGNGHGGGVCLYSPAVTLSDNSILNNLVVYTETTTEYGTFAQGGGASILGAYSATVRGNWVMTNTVAMFAQSTASPQDVWAAAGGVQVQDFQGHLNDSVVLENNHLVANIVVQTMTTSGADSKGHAEGGALWMDSISTTLIVSNEVRSNSAVRYLSLGSGGGDTWGGRPSGGGVHLYNLDYVTMRGNQVQDNITAWRQVANEVDTNSEGGGVSLDNVGNAVLVGNTVRGNTAVKTGSVHSDGGRHLHGSGGGVSAVCWDRALCNLLLENNNISENVAAQTLSRTGSNAEIGGGGGGARLQGNIVAVVRANVISGNVGTASTNDGWNGGIEVIQNRVTMERNLFLGNQQNPSGQGDASGVNIGHGSVVTSTNDILARNYDAFSVHSQSRLILVNGTLFDNTKNGVGTGVNVREQSTLVVSNTIIAGHEVGLRRDDSDPPVVVVEDYNLLYNDTDYEGVPIVSRGDHTILGQDPRFTNGAGDDFHLRPDSPAINRANGVFAPKVDFYGVPRPQGGGWDIGAVERVFLSLPLIMKNP